MLAGVVGSGGDGGTGWGADSDQGGGGWAAPVAVAKKEQPGMISALSRKGRSRCRRGVVHLKIESLEVNNATPTTTDRKSTRLNSSHVAISYAVFCLKKKKNTKQAFLELVR